MVVVAVVVVVEVVAVAVSTTGLGAGACLIVVLERAIGLGAGAVIKICVSTMLEDAMSNRTPHMALKVTLCCLSSWAPDAVQRYVCDEVGVAE